MNPIDQLLREVAALRAALAAQQVALAGQFAQLRADLIRLRARPADAVQAERIHTVHAAMGEREFVAPELFAAALENSTVGTRVAGEFGDASLRGVGTRLSRAAGRLTDDGLVLEKVSEAADLSVWRVFETRKGPSR